MPDDEVPQYEVLLDAAHRAQAPQWRDIYDALHLQDGALVLDAACGDGWHARRLARHIRPRGRLIACDLSPEYLELARSQEGAADRDAIDWTCADGGRLPFADGTFDLAWCAHSMISLPDPVAVLRELRRVTRAGGQIAVLENDTLHNVLFPWPADVELAVRQAELTAYRMSHAENRALDAGRDVGCYFEAAGIEGVRRRTFTQDFSCPVEGDVEEFLRRYLKSLLERVQTSLDPLILRRFRQLATSGNSLDMLKQPGRWIATIEILVTGVAG